MPISLRLLLVPSLAFVITLSSLVSRAQSVVEANPDNVGIQQTARTTVVVPPANAAPRVTGTTNLVCAGYIKIQRFGDLHEIVGAEQEQEQRTFANGDVVYLNAGSQQGVKEGDRFQVIRPRGEPKGVHRNKKGFMGIYIQEVGMLQVFRVMENTSAAQITFTCDAILLGDLLTGIPHREAPIARLEGPLDRFSNPSGKQTGRLMMAQDAREMLSINDVVYIDLGSEDKVAAGDYLTIYRPLGTGTVTRIDNEEIARGRAKGFQSDRFRGGGFSNQAQRAKDSTALVNSEGNYRFRPITTKEIKSNRPRMPRKIVGEMVIIDVQSRTATAVITRVASEVHTGDWVEVQ